MSGFGTSSIWRFSPGALDLALARARRREVGDRGGHDEDVGAGRGAEDRLAHRLGGRRVDDGDAARRGDAHRAGDQRDRCAPVARRLGDCGAHLSGRPVADEPHRVERLARAAGADDDVEALEVSGADEEALDRLDDRRRLRQTADAGQPRGELADLRLDDEVAEVAERGDVALGRRMRPHPGVHRRRHDHRRAAGAGDGGQRVAHQAGGQLADEVRGRRGEHDGIGRLGQLDVRDLLVAVELHDVVEDRPMGEGLEGQRPDESRRRGGHRDVDHRAALAEHPDEGDRLVGGDAARDADDDAAPGERPDGSPSCRAACPRRGSLAVAQGLPRVADSAQREVGLDGVDPGDLAQATADGCSRRSRRR